MLGNSRRFGYGAGLLTGLCALVIATGLQVSVSAAQDTRATAPTVSLQKKLAAATSPAVRPAKKYASASRTIRAAAVSAKKPATAAELSPFPGKPYFIEFRARSALSYGHTFLVHGKVGQKITAKDVIGLHPMGDTPTWWMVGHVVFVKSETGASDGDFEDEYLIASYRIYLSEAEYRPLLAYMREMQANHPIWHAILYNCNAFVGDIARHMGLKAPVNWLSMPKDYINGIKELNDGRQELNPSESQSLEMQARTQNPVLALRAAELQ